MKQSFFDFEIISLQIFQVTILAKPNDLQFRRLIKTNSVPNCIRDERAQWEKREMERFMGPDPETKKTTRTNEVENLSCGGRVLSSSHYLN